MTDTNEAPEAEKMAPVQGWPQGIPWSLHLEAYAAYCKRWSPQKAMIEGGCRGGFSTGELDEFIPGWRDKVSEIGKLKAEIATLRASLAAAPEPTSEQARKRKYFPPLPALPKGRLMLSGLQSGVDTVYSAEQVQEYAVAYAHATLDLNREVAPPPAAPPTSENSIQGDPASLAPAPSSADREQADCAAAIERQIIRGAVAAALGLSEGKDLTLGAKGSAFWAGYETGIEEVETRVKDDWAKLPALSPPSAAPELVRDAPLPTRPEPIDALVTMTITVERDGAVTSDVLTHDNSYAEVATGLAACRDEIARVFTEAKDCPHYPNSAEAANKKIVRAQPTRSATEAELGEQDLLGKSHG